MAAESTLRIALACVILLIASLPLIAQEEPGEADEDQTKEQRLFFDSVDVDLVNVEVVVTDKKGRPVTGLTREDFEIFENGRQVEITNFHEIRRQAPAPDESFPAPQSAPEPGAKPAQDPGDHHVVILVDNMNISPQSRKLLFTRLREHLRQDAEATAGGDARQVMLATLDRKLEVVLPFTGDREKLLATLDEVERQGGSHGVLDGDRRMFMTRLQRAHLANYNPRETVIQGEVMRVEGDPEFDDAVRVALELALNVRAMSEQRYRKTKSTLDVLGRFCDALGGMPQRKALIYLSDGLPMRPADSLAELWNGKFQTWALLNGSDIREHSAYPDADRDFQRVINSLGSNEFDLRRELNQLTLKASSRRVAFYPISTYGRGPVRLSASIGGGGINSSGGMLHNADMLETATRDASLLQLADETGGQALTRSANFGELLDRIDRDFSSYYALGYRPPGPEDEEEASATDEEAAAKPASDKRDDKFRRTKVKVGREEVVVRHGRGYNPRSWRDRLGAMTLASALFEVEDNPLGVELELGVATQEGNRFLLPILLKVPFDQIRLVYQNEQYIGQLTALVVVHNEGNGGVSEPYRIDFPIKISGRRILEAVQQLAGYVVELEMSQGPQRVAIGLRDHFARTEATVNLGVMVGGAS